MSQQQFIHFQVIKFLLGQLRHFGLNPTDWKVDRRSHVAGNQILLINREDREFKFSGNLGVKNGSLGWQNLTLISL